MQRRDLLRTIAAGGSIATLPTSAFASDDGILARHSPAEGESKEFRRDDWVPHHTVDVGEDGTATLSISLEGQNAPSRVSLTKRRANVLEILEGEAALSEGGPTLSWDVDRAASVAFRIRLGGAAKRGMRTGRFENAISSDVQELVQVVQWPDGPDTLPKAYRFTFDPPAGWSVASPGERVGTDTYDLNPTYIQYGQALQNFFAVGDFDVHERAAGASAIRSAKLRAADHPFGVEEVLDLLVDATPLMEHMFGYGRRYPWLALLVPSELERGGLIKGDSIIFGDDEELIDDGGSVYPHEQAGSYIRAVACSGDRCSRWYKNGAKGYLGRYALYEIGRVDHEKLRQMLLAWVRGSNDAREHDDPLAVPATDSSYSKGTAITALLDVEIRARTDGEHDIGAWLSEIEDQRILEYRGEDRHLIGDDEARPLLYEITGVDYTKFYERFVHGNAFPEGFFEEHFTLENPWPVYEAFEYPSVELSAEEVGVDEPVEVAVEMRNGADRSQRRTVDLLVDGASVAATDVQLDPGESTTVTLEHTFADAGEYVVRVPPAYEGTITVGSTAPGQPGLGVLAALAGVGGAIGYSVYRSGEDESR